MANSNTPFGFRPVRHLNGSPYNGQFEYFYLASGESNNVFIGDVVKLAGSADTTYGYATVTVATAGDVPVGVVVGFDVSLGITAAAGPDLNITYRPASTAMYVMVATAPDLVFEVQAASVAATDVGSNIDLDVGSGGNTATGVSSYSASGVATTDTVGFHIKSKSTRPNNAFGAYCVIEVTYNLHAYATSTAGV
jgi:hypothetical protein